MPENDFHPLGTLAGLARRRIAENAAELSRSLGVGVPKTLEARARRPYDILAKHDLARRIAAEEVARAGLARNNMTDAMRHARWSKRTAEATGPVFANLAGIGHEAVNIASSVRKHLIKDDSRSKGQGYDRRIAEHHPPPGQTMDEVMMDLHNNAEGRRAAREGRPIDPSRLQTRPQYRPGTSSYRAPVQGLTGSARR